MLSRVFSHHQQSSVGTEKTIILESGEKLTHAAAGKRFSPPCPLTLTEVSRRNGNRPPLT